MTRLEIEARFRAENPEITANVITAATLHTWCFDGDKEVCAKARLIVDSDTINSVTGQSAYDLTALDKFFSIDEMPGGGIYRVNTDGTGKRLSKTSKAELDSEKSRWRTAASGLPVSYFRRGKYMIMNCPCSSSVDYFDVDYVAISDDFDDDAKLPYNQLPYLVTFHPAINFYLNWRAKAKVGKAEEAATAKEAYDMYVLWMIKSVGGEKFGPITLRPTGLPSSGNQR